MNSKSCDLIIKKLEDLFKFLQRNECNEVQLFQIRDIISQFIDKYIINDNLIASKLLENELKVNKRNLKLKINYDANTNNISINEIYKILHLLKLNLGLIFSKYNKAFNIYIYSEVKEIIKYYINESWDSILFNDVYALYSINQREYHMQISIFKYIYSVFDKLLYINLFLAKKLNLTSANLDGNYIFTKSFAKISKPLYRNEDMESKMIDLMQRLDKSGSFHFLRKLRNDIEHSFTNPESQSNLLIQTELLFILISRVLLEITFDFKPDNEIYNLLVKR